MIAQGFDSPRDFLTERNSRVYFRGKKIPWRIKDQARARVSGEISGLGTAQTEPQELAHRILGLPTPQSVISSIKTAHSQVLAEREIGAAAVLRELALILVPARFDAVVVESIRASLVDPERPVLTPPICTETGAEIAMAAAEEQPARFKPAGPDYDYPDGEFNLDPPPRCGIEDQDDYFKEAWQTHLINKFADSPRLSRFEHTARAKIAVRRLQDTSHETKRTHYVLLYDEGNSADNETWERRARLVRRDCPSLVFLRLSDDERIVTETAAQLAGALRETGKPIRDRLAVKHYLHPGPLWCALDWADAARQAEAVGESEPPQDQDPQARLQPDPVRGCVVLVDEIEPALC